MYHTRTYGLAGSASSYNQIHHPVAAVHRHHFPIKQALFGGMLLAGTLALIFAGMNIRARQMVVYQPASQSANPSVMAPAPEPPVAVPAVAVAPEPVSSEPVADPQLQGILTAWEAAHKNHKWSVVVRGLDGDSRFANLNDQQVFRSASIYKLFLTYPLFKITSLDSLGGISVTSNGQGATLKSCFDAMLQRSDNPCGEAVGNYVGWSRADKMLREAGFIQTQLNNAVGPQTSAADTASLLQNLYAGGLYTDEQRGYVLDLLKNQTLRGGIPAGCPDCVVANKTGELGIVHHDAGIVTFASKSYVLAIFTDGASNPEIAGLTAQIQNYMKPS